MSATSKLDAQAADLLTDGLKRLAQSYRGTAEYCRGDKRPDRGMVYDEMARRVDVLCDAAETLFADSTTAVAEILDEAYADHMALANPVEEATP